MLKAKLTRKSYYSWIVWGLGAAFFFFEYLARVAPSVMVTELMQAFKVNTFQLGSLSAFFFISYVGMQIPVGVLVDRYSPRYLLTVMCILCGLSCIGFAYVKLFWLAEVARFVMGFAASFAFIGAMKLVTVWFSSKRYGLLAGLTQALGMLGAAVSEGGLDFSLGKIGWEATMIAIGLVIILLGLLIWVFVYDHPERENKRQERSANKERHLPLWEGLVHVVRNPQSWINGIYVGLLYASTEAFAELWGVSYLERVDGMSRHIAGIAISLIFLGWTIGGPIVGWLSDYLRRRRSVMIGSAVLSLITLTAALYMPYRPMPLLMLLLFLFGFCNTGVGTGYALASEINSRCIAGVSIAFANMASVVIGALAQPLIGLFLDWQKTSDSIGKQAITLYSPESFKWAMLILPIFLVLSIITSFFIEETNCCSIEELK